MGEEVDKVKEITESQTQPAENVSKEPTLQDKIDKATDDFISALEDANKPDEKAVEAEEQSDKATTDYLSWIDGVIKTVDAKRREAEALNAEQQVADKRIQQFAGIANAAAALINLAGTTKDADDQSYLGKSMCDNSIFLFEFQYLNLIFLKFFIRIPILSKEVR